MTTSKNRKRVAKNVSLRAAEPRADFGHFSGDPVTSWDPDGRTMVLVANFSYTDPKRELWTAAKGSKVDGASIPQVFWSLVGGPYEGQYRNASVVHDTECLKPYKHRWQDVHRMFYSACRAGGVGETLAKVMFAAVYHFGPRWDMNRLKAAKRTLLSLDDFLRARALITHQPAIELGDIENLTHSTLVAQVSDLELTVQRQAENQFNLQSWRLLDEALQTGEFVPGRVSGPKLQTF